MQSSGLKRPLSDSEDEVPENLLPSKDPYPSDDETLNRKQLSNYRDGIPTKEQKLHNVILHRRPDSSEMLAEHVHHFFHLDFIPREQEECLKDASVEECLFHVLRFTSSTDVETDAVTGVKNFKINDENTEEICNGLENVIPGFSWIKDNDRSNFHDLSKEEYEKELNFFGAHASNWENMNNSYNYAKFMLALLKLYKQVYGEKSTADRDLPARSELVKEYLEVIADFHHNKHYWRNGKCKKELHLVAQNLTCDNDMVEDNRCVIMVDPDGVVVGPPSDPIYRSQGSESWLMVIQVYDPSRDADFDESAIMDCQPVPSGVIPATVAQSSSQPLLQNNGHVMDSQRQPSNVETASCAQSSRINIGQCQPLPQNNDPITNPKSCPSIRDRILASIPSQCSASTQCVHQIAGQHVVQLFTMAQETLLNCERKNTFSSEKSSKCAKAIGLFIVDEFVYFSKLLVEDYLMWYLMYGTVTKKHLPELIENKEEMARMCYGNFRLDLTISNHRKAFILFVTQIIRKSRKH